jgi:hypothetical protein
MSELPNLWDYRAGIASADVAYREKRRKRLEIRSDGNPYRACGDIEVLGDFAYIGELVLQHENDKGCGPRMPSFLMDLAGKIIDLFLKQKEEFQWPIMKVSWQRLLVGRVKKPHSPTIPPLRLARFASSYTQSYRPLPTWSRNRQYNQHHIRRSRIYPRCPKCGVRMGYVVASETGDPPPWASHSGSWNRRRFGVAEDCEGSSWELCDFVIRR